MQNEKPSYIETMQLDQTYRSGTNSLLAQGWASSSQRGREREREIDTEREKERERDRETEGE